MTYLLGPYFWARPKSWPMRQAISVPADPRHEAFLKAGTARVFVPVAPGMESRLLQYLGSHPDLPEWLPDLELEDWDPVVPVQRIPPLPEDAEALTEGAVAGRPFEELWLELLTEFKPDTLRGSGQLDVTVGSDQAFLVGTTERVGQDDIGRAVYLEGVGYEIVGAIEPAGGKGYGMTLDRNFAGSRGGPMVYATGAVRRGAPWQVRVPTGLLILHANRADLAGL